MAMSVPDFIGALGGPAKVADALSGSYTTVASWRQRKSIPVEYWPRLVELARQSEAPELKEADYETMVRLHTEAA